MCWRGVKHVSKQEITISRIYNNKVRVLYYFYLTLFCRKSRLYFGGRRAIPTACGGRSTIGVVVAFRLIHSVLIFCSTGLCTRMLFITLTNFIIVHRIISEKMHLKYEKITETAENREVKGAWNHGTWSYLIYFNILRTTLEKWNFRIIIFKLRILWANIKTIFFF